MNHRHNTAFQLRSPRLVVDSLHRLPDFLGNFRQLCLVTGNAIRRRPQWPALLRALEGRSRIDLRVSGEPSPALVDRQCRGS